ncbi:MAG: hypothetical protein LBE79_06335 [Tannerella sp.]|nr:hypothetical protein [Tannerella sp.]
MRVNKLKSLSIFILMLLWGLKLQAQGTLIDVKIDNPDIFIGEQTVIQLTVTTDQGKLVYWPIPLDTLMTGVEVLALSKPDSTTIDNNRLMIKQDVLITSFDEELYLLPPFKVIDDGDTILSNQVALKVSTIEVNVDAPEEFFDIKDVWKPPFVLADYYPLIFGILLILFMICVIGYIIQRLRKNKASVPLLKKDEPKLPPHELAIRELNEIKLQKLWQQGRNKEYYTQITDTLRRYIHRRFDINAMEMTSYEILEIITRENDAQSVYDTLRQILQLADLVKFAKWRPLPDENDLSMAYAYLFVNQTKQVEMVKSEENTEEGGEK